jgi:hypothetical protein
MRDDPDSALQPILYCIAGGLLAVLVASVASIALIDWQTLRTELHEWKIYALLGGVFFCGVLGTLRVLLMIGITWGRGTMAR